LREGFIYRLQDFRKQKILFQAFGSLFEVGVEAALEKFKMELVDSESRE
jgi:hypothetical protein